MSDYKYPPLGISTADVDSRIDTLAFLLDGSNAPLEFPVPGGVIEGVGLSSASNTVSPTLNLLRSRASDADAQSGDVLGSLSFRGRSGGDFVPGGQLYVQVETALVGGNFPSSMHLTLRNSAGVEKEMLSLNGNTGILVLGVSGSPQVHQVHGSTQAPAAQTINITNAPFAGTGVPAAYGRIKWGNTEYLIPLLPAS